MLPPLGEVIVTLLFVFNPPLVMLILPPLPALTPLTVLPPALGPSDLVPVPRAIYFYSFRVFIVSTDL
jgi:hypothetical protein